jgi:ferredoxin
MNEITKKLQEVAKELLEKKEVDLIIGYEKGTENFWMRPCFVEDLSDVDKLIFNGFCNINLSKYLLEHKDKKVAIFLKGCDSKSIVAFLQEKQINRENVKIIGIPCFGVFEENLIDKNIDYNSKPEDNIKFLEERCKVCENHNPLIYDILISEKIEEKTYKENIYEEIEEIEKKSTRERFEFFKRVFSRCIRCLACRNICPVCFCKECLIDKNNPVWVERKIDLSNILMLHLIRAIHMAGRCIDCGSCEEVCPSKIPLRKIYKKLEKDVKEMFNYIPGRNPDLAPFNSIFSKDDKDEYLKGEKDGENS